MPDPTVLLKSEQYNVAVIATREQLDNVTDELNHKSLYTFGNYLLYN